MSVRQSYPAHACLTRLKNADPLQWLLVTPVLAGVTLWSPGYGSWGLIASALLAGLVFRLIRGIMDGRSRIEWPPVQWLWVLLAAIGAGHMLVDQYDAYLHWTGGSVLRGGIINSFWFQMGLIWLGVMLYQHAFPRRLGESFFNDLPLFLLAVGAAVVALVTDLPFGSDAVWLVALAATALWLLPALRGPVPDETDRPASHRDLERRRTLWGVRLVLSAFPVAALAFHVTARGAALGTLAVAMAAVLLPLARRAARWRGAAALVLALGLTALWAVVLRPSMPFCPLGAGERGLLYTEPTDWGANLLVAFTGEIGLFLVLAFSLLMTVCGRTDGRPRWWPALLVFAPFAATVGWLSPGGLSNPLVTCGLIVVWGRLAPECRPRWGDGLVGGWRLAVLLAGAIGLLIIAAHAGLVSQLHVLYLLHDRILHRVLGFLLTLCLAWWGSSRAWYWGLAGLLVGAAAGLGVEYVQYFATHVLKASGQRAAERADVVAHVLGAAAAAACWLVGLWGRHAQRRGRHGFAARGLLAAVAGLWLLFWLTALGDALHARATSSPAWACASDLVCIEPHKRDRKGRIRPLFLPGAASDEHVARVFAYTRSQRLGRLDPCWGKVSTVTRNGQPVRCCRLLPQVTQAPEERDRRDFYGSPYGPLAYTRNTPVRTLRIRADEPLWIIDARDVFSGGSDERAAVAQQIRALDRTARVTLACPFWADKLRAIKAEAVATLPDIPILCTPCWNENPVGLARQLRGWLAVPKGSRRPSVRVISTDPAFQRAFQRHFPRDFQGFDNLPQHATPQRKTAVQP